jgi:hypothetical protein
MNIFDIEIVILSLNGLCESKSIIFIIYYYYYLKALYSIKSIHRVICSIVQYDVSRVAVNTDSFSTAHSVVLCAHVVQVA